jgi:F5/8 type C domain/Curlin associated repeat
MKKILFALMFVCSNAFAAITDGKFGINQIFDVQYWWNGNTLNASNFIAPYNKNFVTVTTTAGQYFQFFPSTTNPGKYGLKLMNSNGTQHSIVHDHGDITALGNGAIFYIGSGFFGNVITTAAGYNYGASAQFTNMDTSVTSSDLNNYTFASSTPLAAGQTAAPAGPPPADWKLIRTNSTPVVISTIFPTSNNSPFGEGATQAFDGNVNTKYLNFDKKNAGVTVKLSQGRVVQKFTITTANDFSGRDPTSYKLYGSNDGVNWTLIKQDSLSLSESRFWTSPEIATGNTTAYVYYFILFPTTKAGEFCGLNCDSMQIAEVTYYYDLNDGVTSTDTGSGGTPANPGQAGSVCADCAPSWPSTSDITVGQTAQKNSAKGRVSNVTLGNSLYIDQKIGSSNNTVTIEQTGNYNKIAGLGGTDYAIINGSSNTLNIKQGDTLGKNLIEFSVTGNTNNITLWQARNPTTGLQDGNESGGHYMGLNVTGSTNTLSLKQANDGGTASGHFAYVDVTGNNNQGTLKQTGNGEKTFFGIVNGNTNVFDVTQQGSGSFLDLSLTGNGHNVSANQKDAGSHKATINLTNAGGASNVTLVQQGATAQNINITQQCATLSGCSVSVTQGQ